MKMCMPPTPSSLCGTPFISFGMKPCTLRPVVSVRYLPTLPVELPSPCGNFADFELRRMPRRLARAGREHDDARLHVVLAPGVLVDVGDAGRRPVSSTVTSRAIALATIVSFLVAIAGGIRTDGDEKFAWIAQPRPHCPQ